MANDNTKKRQDTKAWLNSFPPELNPLLHETGGRWIPCNEWWADFPDHPGAVRADVALCVAAYNQTAVIRIGFWGNDDFGMTLDVPYTLDNLHYWNDWLTGLSFIDSLTLHGLGFENY